MTLRRLDHHRHRLRGKPSISLKEERERDSRNLEEALRPKAKPAKHTREELRAMADKAFKEWTKTDD
jgi:ElaB/YqjD/DUF883 family membrane-anchored ribosome-binding protein